MVVLIFLVVYIQEPWRWTCFGDFRVVNSISCGPRYVYIGGDNGIMRFDKLKGGWTIPATRNPFPDSVNLVAVDVGANEVWFTTKKALGRYNPVFEDYNLNDLPHDYGIPCSLGIGTDYVYLWNRYQCIKFNKLTREWSRFSGMPSDVEWFPKVSPSKYPWLAPYYVMDKYLNRYGMSCAAEDGQWVWVGTRGQGIYKYNSMTYMDESHFTGLGVSGDRALTMLKDGEYVWVGTPEEIVRWDLGKGLSTYYLPFAKPSLLESEMPGLLPSEATSIVGDEKWIWLGTAQGLFQLDKKSGDWNKFSTHGVTSLALEKGELWVGSQNGLSKLEDGRVEKILDSFWVNDIKVKPESQKREAEIWIATSRGVIKKSGDKWSKFEDPDKILPHGVYRILFEGDKVYFGTNRQGLLIYQNEKWNKFTYPVYLAGERILSMANDSLELYVGTDAGVSVWDKPRNIWRQYTEENSPVRGAVYSIFLDKEYAYFGTNRGVIRLSRE